MEPTTSTPPPTPPPDDTRARARRAIIVGVVLGAIVIVITVKVRWWHRGGPGRSMKGLAEVGAVALADAIVDELLPG
jgi:hypothetical protein